MEGVMRYFAEHNGFAGEADFWGIVGLLHDVDFERFPEEHCRKAPELFTEIDAPFELVHAVCSHGWDITVDVKPEHFMEKGPVFDRRADRTDLGNSADASVKKCPGHGTEIPQEEVQVKGLRRRLLSRSD